MADCPTPTSRGDMSASIPPAEGDDETSPLLPKLPSVATPLPKLQLTILVLLKMAEAFTFHLIQPFVTVLVKETGVIDGDEGKLGYYVGILVCYYLHRRLNSH
jgi:hypothetical protein